MSDVANVPISGEVSNHKLAAVYIQATHEAMDERRTTVVVHAFSSEQQGTAAEFLAGRGGEVTKTL